MEKRTKLTVTRREWRIMGERRGRVKLRNMYKEPMDKDIRWEGGFGN